jgi:outer membrane protein TolC
MHVEDCKRLVPSDAPTLAEVRPDWAKALRRALANRPELFMARQDVKANQLNVQLARNLLMPDLRTFAADTNSIGTRLDGPGQDNALRNLGSNTFNDWTVGLRLAVPIGYRLGHAQLRQAQLLLARSYFVLQDQELKAERFLGLQYRRMSSGYAKIKAARAQREAFATQLKARQEKYLAGQGSLDVVLEAQRFWADALNTEYQAVVTYNNARCCFQYAKGTIQRKDRVTVADSAPPGEDTVRAVDRERRRTRAQVRRVQGLPADALPTVAGGEAEGKHPTAPSLPALWKSVRPLAGGKALPVADALPR